MKRFAAILCVIALSVSLASCRQQVSRQTTTAADTAAQQSTEQTTVPPQPEWQWQSSAPEEQGLNGEVFAYSTANTHLLCAVVQQATGQTLYEFGKENLFDPVGMESVTCDTDAQGISDGGNGIYMSIYDMARFGLLYLNGGEWQGERIVPAEWVEQSTTLQFERNNGSADYGFQWWVRTFGDNDYPAYFAQGHAGQYIFVVPELELIIAFTGNWLEGERFRSSASESDVTEWVNGLDL